MNKSDIERIQRNTVNAEQSLIGSILVDNGLMNEIKVTSDNFFLSECAMIFQAMEALHAERKPFDLVTLSDWLSSKRGVDYFTQLAEYAHATPSAANGKTYAEKVKEYWRSREACRIAAELSEIRKSNDQDMIDKAISQLMSLNVSTRNYNHSAAEVIDSALAKVQEACESETGCTGLRTGINEFDEVTGGLNRTDLIIVGARPAMGKTAFMLNIATRHSDIRAGICSGEQGHEQMGMRMLSIHGSINGARMRNGELGDEELTKLTGASAKLYHADFWVDDTPNMCITDIERRARQWVHENGVNALFVDYLQKIKHPEKNMQKVDQIADVAIRLKSLGKELNIPVVALAQVNRAVENRPDKRPSAADIKDCGVIEQEADSIITLYRDEVYNESTPDHGIAELIFCKNRHGPTGTKRVNWIGKYMQFNDFKYTR